MIKFSADYTCFECGRKGEPDHGEHHVADEYDDGFYLSCPDCKIMIAGPKKATVEAAIVVLAGWSARINKMMGQE